MSFFGWYLTRISLLTHYVNFSSAFAQNSFCLSFLNLKRKVMRLEGQKESPTQKIYANFAQLGIRQLQNGEGIGFRFRGESCVFAMRMAKQRGNPASRLFVFRVLMRRGISAPNSQLMSYSCFPRTHTYIFPVPLFFLTHTRPHLHMHINTHVIVHIYLRLFSFGTKQESYSCVTQSVSIWSLTKIFPFLCAVSHPFLRRFYLLLLRAGRKSYIPFLFFSLCEL